MKILTNDYEKMLTAAAIMADFDLAELQPFGEVTQAERSELLKELERDCTPLYNKQGQLRWSLEPEIRREGLRLLEDRSTMRQALAANPKRNLGPLQLALEICIEGKPINYNRLDAEQAEALLRVSNWLTGLLPDLPDRQRLTQIVAFQNLLKPLVYLADASFRGRANELARLRRYVEAELSMQPPLLIYGAGGMGKSALLGKFILNYVQEHHIPFAYLDFDRPGILNNKLMLLLVEIGRQLAVQYPHVKLAVDKLNERWLFRVEELQFSAGLETLAQEVGSYGLSQEYQAEFATEFGQLLQQHGLNNQPYLLALDTFEEVQYRSLDYVEELAQFLGQLQAAIPSLRCLLAGRAPISSGMGRGLVAEPMLLEKLDDVAADSLLEYEKVTEPELRRQVVAKADGNPLLLKLSAVLIREDLKQGYSVTDLIHFFAHLDQTLQHGYLYSRVLGHLHDESGQVQKLAYPGLALRRLTPEIIFQVLKRPCQLKIKTLDEARTLFEKLKREVSLISLEPDGALRHRADVRREMLPILRKAAPKRFVQINKLAVEYLSKQNTLDERVEEIYHRLMLEQLASEINPRLLKNSEWLVELGDRLRRALPELPLNSQILLASLTRIELGDGVRWQANLSNWELLTQSRVVELLNLNRPQDALTALHEREGRSPDSPLFVSEAGVLERLGRVAEAVKVINNGIRSVAASGNEARLLELLMLGASYYQQLAQPALSQNYLEESEEIAHKLNNQQIELTAFWQHLTLLRNNPSLNPSITHEKLEKTVVALVERLPEEQLQQAPQLMRTLNESLGQIYPAIRSKIYRLLPDIAVESKTSPLTKSTSSIKNAYEDSRLRSIEKSIEDAYNLLSEYDKLLGLSTDPKEHQSNRYNRERLRNQISQLEQEWEEIKNRNSQNSINQVPILSGESSPRLTTEQALELADCLSSSIRGLGDLEKLLYSNLTLSKHAPTLPQSTNKNVQNINVIEWAEKQGILDEFIREVLSFDPKNKRLYQIALELGITLKK